MSPAPKRDHGGGLDAARVQYGGVRTNWLDLSTGINPIPYPLPKFTTQDWTALPDEQAMADLLGAARLFWGVSKDIEIVAAPGASALIARSPALGNPSTVKIPGPTYNEHGAAFRAAGWSVTETTAETIADALVVVHPNNPDGRVWSVAELNGPQRLTIIDESFCDVMPDASLIELTNRPGVVVLKSFGKFWGLAGMRLGFAIGQPDTLRALRELIGPWAVSGPALRVGAKALNDTNWARQTRDRLAHDAARLDTVMTAAGAQIVGGTTLFRLYDVGDAQLWQDRLARAHIWSRVFPYSKTWLRLGLPGSDPDWAQLTTALERS
jgi:cobalamin biosynthetic protein CobC